MKDQFYTYNRIKFILVFFISFFYNSSVFSQEGVSINASNFPDDNFRTWIINNIPGADDGYLTQSELDAVTKIDCYGINIGNTKGLNYFSNLENLWFQYANIGSFDGSDFKHLKSLSIGDCQLTYLNVSQNTALIHLHCSYNRLTELDVSNNSELSYLTFEDNQLMCIDLHNITKLTTWSLAKQKRNITAEKLSSGIGVIVPNSFDMNCVNSLTLDGNAVTGKVVTESGKKYLVFASSDTGKEQINGKKLTYEYYTNNSMLGNMPVTVSLTYNPEESTPTVYSLSITSSGNGIVSYSGVSIRNTTQSFSVNQGTRASISFSPDSGYRVKSVRINGSSLDVGSNYTVTVNSNTTVEVEFEAIPSTTYTLTISASGSGSASYSGESIRGGTKAFTINEGTRASISFSPDNGYQVKSVKVNGSSVSASSSYTVTVNSNTTVSVEFEAKPDDTPITPTYTLSISASGSGSASYGGSSIRSTTRSFTLDEGTSATISFSPDDGYRIASVSVNGSSMGTNSSVTVTMNSNKTVSVVFEEIPVVTYDMTITSKGNGEVSYSGSSVREGMRTFKVNEGSSPRVTFSPDLGNRTKSVKLNGSEVNFSGNRYTISNVRGDNTLEVEFEELESKFTSDGVNYEVSSFENMAVKIAIGDFGLSIEVPEKVTNQEVDYKIDGFTDEAMNANKDLAAIIWNPENAISFKNSNPNLLLYVKDTKYAPAGISNIVVGEAAESIVLAEAQNGNNFYCPKAFTAKQITYSHRYRMRTGSGESRGWETIALPFDVQKVEHNDEGEIIPFAKWTSSSISKPFWLYQLGTTGFVEADGIKAYTPYIISMPNNEVYRDEYILRGTITFSSTNVEVKKSDDVVKAKYGDRTFIPNFINLENNAGYYALNVNNDFEAYQGAEKEGSVFIQNLRQIHPFEAYMTSTAGTRSIGIFDGMATAIRGIEEKGNGQQTLKVYNLNGQCIKTGSSMNELRHELPTGLYIINNRKIIIK